MYSITVSVLPVGQGSMNLIEVYETEMFRRELVGLTMIDCGSARSRPCKNTSLSEYERAAVKYAAERMKQRFKQGDGLYLDNLIFTHRDSDHWVLFDNLWGELFGEDYSLVEGNPDEQTGVRWLDVDENCFENYYTSQSGQNSTYEYQVFYNTPYSLGRSCEIEGKIIYRNEEELSKLSFRNKWYGGVFQAGWGTAGLSMKAYIPEKEENLLKVKLVRSQDRFIIHGIFRGEDQHWDVMEDPQSEDGIRQLIVTFAMELLGEEKEFKGLEDIGDFLQDKFVPKSREEIEMIIESGVQINDVIGCTYVGGYADADYGKKGYLTGVGKMLQRAHIASRSGVVELDRDRLIPITDKVILLVLERLEVEALQSIKVEDGAEIKLDILKNGTSGVSVLINTEDEDVQRFFFPGDATAHTFYGMILDLRYQLFSNAVWTAPHHGSIRTISGKAEGEEVEMLPWLLDTTEPSAMVVSAGLKNRHGHPNFSFMECMDAYFQNRKKGIEKHGIYYSLNDDKHGDWHYTIIRYPVYTSIQTDDGIDFVYQNHRFTINGSSKAYKYSKIIQSTYNYAIGIPKREKVRDTGDGQLSDGKRTAQKEEIPSDRLFLPGNRKAF